MYNPQLETFLRDPDRGWKVHISGRKIYHSILQRLCGQGKEYRKSRGRADSYRNLAHDARRRASGAVAKDS